MFSIKMKSNIEGKKQLVRFLIDGDAQIYGSHERDYKFK